MAIPLGYNEVMPNPECAECRAIAKEFFAAIGGSKPVSQEAWAKFIELLHGEADDLPIIGIRRDPHSDATSRSKAYLAVQKMVEHHAKTGHKIFSKS